jgi:hypothetical protein
MNRLNVCSRARVEPDPHPGVGLGDAPGEFVAVQSGPVVDQSDTQPGGVRGPADFHVTGVDGALATATESDRPATGSRELGEQRDRLGGRNGVLEREEIIKVLFVRRMEVAEVAAHVASAHDPDSHVDRADLPARHEVP